MDRVQSSNQSISVGVSQSENSLCYLERETDRQNGGKKRSIHIPSYSDTHIASKQGYSETEMSVNKATLFHKNSDGQLYVDDRNLLGNRMLSGAVGGVMDYHGYSEDDDVVIVQGERGSESLPFNGYREDVRPATLNSAGPLNGRIGLGGLSGKEGSSVVNGSGVNPLKLHSTRQQLSKQAEDPVEEELVEDEDDDQEGEVEEEDEKIEEGPLPGQVDYHFSFF